MVTVTVAVILITVAVPSFRQIIANQRIRNTSFDLFSALNFARSEAIKRNTPVTLRAGAAADGAWSTGWRVVDPTNAAVSLRSWGAPSNLSITDLGGVTAVTYGLDGRVSAPAPKLTITSSISMSGLTQRCVKADLSGRPTTATGSCS